MDVRKIGWEELAAAKAKDRKQPNTDAMRAARRRCYLRNKEKYRAAAKKWNEDNKPLVRALKRVSNWRRAIRNARRRVAKLRSIDPRLRPENWQACVDVQELRMAAALQELDIRIANLNALRKRKS